jgi:hypothetical protein
MRLHIFADASGNFDFSAKKDASRFFILTAATLADCSEANAQLSALRHQLASEGRDHAGPFHAAHAPGPIRDRVFDLIDGLQVRVDAVVLEKAKAMPHIRATDERFDQHAWLYLMKYMGRRLSCDEPVVVAASIGNKKKKRTAFYEAVRDVMNQAVGLIVVCR